MDEVGYRMNEIHPILLYIKYKTFQVLSFWMIDINGMVGWLMQLMQDAHLPTALGSSCEHGITEVVLGHDL